MGLPRGPFGLNNGEGAELEAITFRGRPRGLGELRRLIVADDFEIERSESVIKDVAFEGLPGGRLARSAASSAPNRSFSNR